MNKKSKFFNKLLLSIAFLFFLTPIFVLAQNNEQIFKAQVIEILEQEEVIREDGSEFIQQNIKLKELEGKWQDKEIIIRGIGELEVVAAQKYQVGDKVLVAYTLGPEGEENYYIIDYIRHPSLYLLALIFVLLVVLIGRWKGLRALVGLLVSFFIIMKFIVPKILTGSNPLFIAITGSILILLFVVYLTEGINQRSYYSVLAITLSLVMVGIISLIFTKLTKLTGLAQEEVMFLIGYGQGLINFQGLLLAGIIIGTLGVLDDVVISQVVSAEQIKKANPNLSSKEVYKKVMTIGVSHMSSMINTLFLVYAGASLPLLLLFNIGEPPFLTFNQIINHEVLATEVVRTLTGSIGLVLSVPLATFLASYFLKVKREKNM